MPALGRQRQVGLSEFQDSLDLHREKSKTKEIVFEKIIFNYMHVHGSADIKNRGIRSSRSWSYIYRQWYYELKVNFLQVLLAAKPISLDPSMNCF